MYKQQILNYLDKTKTSHLSLKAVLFDMDGVLFDSMPNHVKAWRKVMEDYNLVMSEEEVYMNEGRTGKSTINRISQRELGRDATEEEVQRMYELKSSEFNKLPKAERMTGAYELIQQIERENIVPMVVTGSGQKSLLGKLDKNFPNTFKRELMVTAFDVKHGKPNPEPYLMALKKGGFKADEAIVVENAPLGVEAAVAAGIFTVAVNTGPLDDSILANAGANIIFPSMQDLSDNWESLRRDLMSLSV